MDNPLKDNIPVEIVRAKHAAANEIFNLMVRRNLDGIQLEKTGQVDEAIKLYELNIKDCFPGTHPYDRLRIIYSKRKQYADALRICRAFVALPGRDKAVKFLEHIKRLEAEAGKVGGIT